MDTTHAIPALPTLAVADAQFVTPFLAVGGDLAFDDELACEQAAELELVGVTHVLDVRHEADDAELWSYFEGITYRLDGIDDAGQRIPTEWFDGTVEWALDAIETGGVVLTHCHMGVNRGPSVGYAVLLALGWDSVDALAAIRRVRPIANVWYAEDALRWHLHKNGVPKAERAAAYRRIDAWRNENPLDVVRVIGQQRATKQ